MNSVRAHDLLWLGLPGALQTAPEAAGESGHAALLDRAPWLTPAWLADAPVVVRRAAGPAGWLPVGLRGRLRAERCAAWLPARTVRRCVTPEHIARSQAWREPSASQQVAAVAAIGPIAAVLNDEGVRWGIGGGVGFALATNLPVLRPDSDLDLIVRADDEDEFMRAARALNKVLDNIADTTTAPIRIDVQIDTPAGGFAFAEWQRTGGPVMLKTADGPLLLSDPWQVEITTPMTVS
ncbi:malonate decarboxylase holo-ACP synthase [Pigmentiphaga aceris]|uniref:malonate decarboxylase holo-ACP synthase n=1 Tax=Pigmentiphaga aceris TaxID=1940612 RepID=UPI001652B2AC|nr:malonate decarboxylase holo-ACP synthase [Pigmentiphaga aceris]